MCILSVCLDFFASPSHSSFEVLDPHDPTLSRHATHLFKKTNDYLQGEIASGGVRISLYMYSLYVLRS